LVRHEALEGLADGLVALGALLR